MGALEDRLLRFAYVWHDAMKNPLAVNMMPMLLEAASDVRSLAAPSLEAENAKLRERVAELEELEDGKRYIPQEWYQLAMAENAKLRELCADLYAIRDRSGTYHVTALQVRLDELGIEVD